ncbi:MAG: class I SAM-dependent methyltransferase [bacterium]|nr:class I SAM-dependent methyltransferase [bacterium]
MNRFYSCLADYYHLLFPLNKVTVTFVRSFLTAPRSQILDIGSATGQLVLALANPPDINTGEPGTSVQTAEVDAVGTITAIEPDEKMAAYLKQMVAEHGVEDRLTVLTAGMLDIDSLFKGNAFHMALCLGNTLVHLKDMDEVRRFMISLFKKIKPGGVFIFQIVNYTRILNRGITELPVIDKPQVSLTRHYKINKTGSGILFVTRLTLKETETVEVIENELSLFPLQRHQVEPICREAGFDTVACYGNFNRQPWNPDSPALVMVLQKP